MKRSPRGFPGAWQRIKRLPACLREDESVLMSARWVGQRMYAAGWKEALKEATKEPNAKSKAGADQRAVSGEAAADADR